MLTKKDRTLLIQDFQQVFVTKDELKNELKKVTDHLENKIVEFKDEIIGKIENLEINTTIDSNIHDQVDEHETRIVVIEKHLHISSETS